MKRVSVTAAAIVAVAISALAAYTNYYTDSLTSINAAKWTTVGSAQATSSGLVVSSQAGGAVVGNNLLPPDGSYNYQVKAFLNLTTSGGYYTVMVRATSNAQPASQSTGPTGSFYALELQNPQVDSGGNCTGLFEVYKVESGSVTIISQFSAGCGNYHTGGMWMWLLVRPGEVVIYTSTGVMSWPYGDGDLAGPLAAGQPGVGGYGMPVGNSISSVQLGPYDSYPPAPINGQSITEAVFSDKVELHWAGVNDDPNGEGLNAYIIWRNGSVVGFSYEGPDFVDETAQPNTQYEYTIAAKDNQDNWNSQVSTSTFTTPPAGTVELRRPGVRPTGSYWGAAGEQIDAWTGGLNFTQQLIHPQARGSWNVPLSLNYNSGIWRNDTSSGRTYLFGQDVGYGLGWKLLAGSVRPVWFGTSFIDHYVYTDSTGAEYNLTQTTATGNNQTPTGLWASTEGIFLTFDASASILHFYDGSFWEMYCQSSGGEQDAGTLYPTVMEDSNGNQILIHYNPGSGVVAVDTSARIASIEDIREPQGVRSYTFTYTYLQQSDAFPHLTSVTNGFYNTSEAYSFSYVSGQTLASPWGDPFGQTTLLTSVTQTGIQLTSRFQYSSGNTGEMTQMSTPLGGTLAWIYGSASYVNRNYRMVQWRYMTPVSGGSQYSWYIFWDGSTTARNWTVVSDSSAGTNKAWWFNTSGPYLGLASAYGERNTANTDLVHKNYTWAQNPAGNLYMNSVTSILDPTQSYAATTQITQTLDNYGNVSQSQTYDYGNPNTPARTYTYQYLHQGSQVNNNGNTNNPCQNLNPYCQLYILNRVTTVSANGSQIVANNYDGLTYQSSGNVSDCGQMITPPQTPILHDEANYGAGGVDTQWRGLISNTSNPNGYNCYSYQTTAVPVYAKDGAGDNVSATTTGGTNYSLPTTLTPNGNTNFTTSLSYSGAFAVAGISFQTSANNTTGTSASYDAYGRLASSTMVDGASTSYSYAYFNNGGLNTQTATLGTQFKRATLDGFGRTTRIENGYTTDNGAVYVTVNQVDTQYAPAASSPLGMVSAVSYPYVPGQQEFLRTYTYDGRGRTTTVKKPDNGPSTINYAYQGNSTTVTDPTGNWKTFTRDALGNLTLVTEPNPGGGQNLTTTYTYDIYGDITGVSMPRTINGQNITQTRSFAWAYPGKLASSTNPENGTVTYGYDGAGRVTARTDAKQQKTQWTYDSYGRVTMVQHFAWVSNAWQEDTNQRWTYYYDSTPAWNQNLNFSQNPWGRLTGVRFTAQGSPNKEPMAYLYSYNQAGRVIDQKLRLYYNNSSNDPRGPFDLDALYTWDSQGRMTSFAYPGGGSVLTNVPPSYTYSFDNQNRLSTIQETVCNPNASGGCNYQTTTAASAIYTPLGQLSSLSYGSLGLSWGYDNLMELTSMSGGGLVNGVNQTLFSMLYTYSSTQNNGRMTQSTDQMTGESVNYTYDSLNRLTAAQATSGGWGETYNYDTLGNPSGSNGNNQSPTGSYDANGNQTPAALTYDMENRLLTPAAYTYYSYDPHGKRVFQVWWNTGSGYGNACEVDFYGLNGRKIGSFECGYDSVGNFQASLNGYNLYFKGKPLRSTPAVNSSLSGSSVSVVTDRYGSVRGNANGEIMRYSPYGSERTSMPDGQDKWGTYFRDLGTGLEYADQRFRWLGSLGFLTPDPGGIHTADPSNPGSWNRYTYSVNDPINFHDPSGLISCDTDDDDACYSDSPCDDTDDSSCGDDGGGGGGGDPCANSTATWCTVATGNGSSNGSSNDSDNGADNGSDDGTSEGPDPDPSWTSTSNCVAGFEVGGGIIGAGLGWFFGGVAGVTAGASGGTLVAPGFGTLSGGVVGGALGSGEGATLGAQFGALAGGLLGNVLCSEEHTSNASPSKKPKHQEGKARKRASREKSSHPKYPPRKRPDGWKGPWEPGKTGWNY